MWNTSYDFKSNFFSQICDLGSAQSLEHTARQTTAVGTYAWMAPEVYGVDNSVFIVNVLYSCICLNVILRDFAFVIASDVAKREGLQILRCVLIWCTAFWDSNTATTIPRCASRLGTWYDDGGQGRWLSTSHFRVYPYTFLVLAVLLVIVNACIDCWLEIVFNGKTIYKVFHSYFHNWSNCTIKTFMARIWWYSITLHSARVFLRHVIHM